MRDPQYTSRRKIMGEIEQKKELMGIGQIFGETLSDKDREYYNAKDKEVLAVINKLEQDLEQDGLKNPAHLEMDGKIKKLKIQENALGFLEDPIITVWPKVKGMIA